MKGMLTFIMVVAGLNFATSANAGVGCPEMPVTAIHNNAVKGNAEAGLLTKLISKFQVGGEITKTEQDVYQRDGSIERAKMVELTVQCQLLLQEYPNNPEKMREEFRKEFSYLFQVPLPVPSRSTQRPASIPQKHISEPTHNPAPLSAIAAHTPAPIHRELVSPTSCAEDGVRRAILVSRGLSNFGASQARAFAKEVGCGYKIDTDLASSQRNLPLNVIAMRGPITYRTQVAVIRALIKSGVFIQAVCVSHLATQPNNTILMTHASFNNYGTTSEVAPMTRAELLDLSRTENSHDFNVFLAGQRRCNIP